MNVTELLSTLAAKDVDVELIDRDTEETIVSFKSGGYASLQDDIESKTVTKWKINNSSSIVVYVVSATSDIESGGGTDTTGD